MESSILSEVDDTSILRTGSPRRYGCPLNWLPTSRLLPRAAGWSAATLCHDLSGHRMSRGEFHQCQHIMRNNATCFEGFALRRNRHSVPAGWPARPRRGGNRCRDYRLPRMSSGALPRSASTLTNLLALLRRLVDGTPLREAKIEDRSLTRRAPR